MNKFTLLMAVAGVLMLAGCFRLNAEVPEPPTLGGPPPSGNIRPAHPDNKSDVVRENQELRARNAWLERQIEGRQKKRDDLRRDQQNIQADINRIQREKERYQ